MLKEKSFGREVQVFPVVVVVVVVRGPLSGSDFSSSLSTVSDWLLSGSGLTWWSIASTSPVNIQKRNMTVKLSVKEMLPAVCKYSFLLLPVVF